MSALGRLAIGAALVVAPAAFAVLSILEALQRMAPRVIP